MISERSQLAKPSSEKRHRYNRGRGASRSRAHNREQSAMSLIKHVTCGSAVCAAALVTACAAISSGDWASNIKPAFVPGAIAKTNYDGVADDLLTAGLRQNRLAGAGPPPSPPRKPNPGPLGGASAYH